MGFELLSKIIFYYSFAWLLILLPILIYRVKFYKVEIPSQANMTLAIFAAPASLCLAGYLGVFQPSMIMLTILVPISYVLTLYVYSLLPRFLRLPFSLGFAPLTFPLAIGVVATQRYATFLTSIGSTWAGFFTQIFFIQLIIATLVIRYVVYKTLQMLIIYLRTANYK
jgi:exfoliative toxin A/B